MTSDTHAGAGRFFSQPKAVWAVAFAAVVSFMGLGLVDPILPAIAKDLDASPSQVELLFTSYVAFTGVSMHSFGNHADVAQRILDRAAEVSAAMIVVGPESPQATLSSGVAARIAATAPSHVVVVNPAAGALGRPVAAAAKRVDAERLWGAAR